MEHKIIIAGIGPGNPNYVLPAVKDIIDNAKILVGGKRALKDFSHNGQKTLPIASDIDSVVDFICKEAQNEDVVVLVSGDPGYYSMLDRLREEFSTDKLLVLPGIGSMQYAFCKLALPWHDAKLVSFHGRIPKDEDILYQKGAILGTLTDGIYHSHKIAEYLMERKWPKNSKMSVCARLSYDDEVIIKTTLGEVQNTAIQKHAIVIVEGI